MTYLAAVLATSVAAWLFWPRNHHKAWEHTDLDRVSSWHRDDGLYRQVCVSDDEVGA